MINRMIKVVNVAVAGIAPPLPFGSLEEGHV